MQANILVFNHDSAGGQGRRDIEILFKIVGWRQQPGAEIVFIAIVGEVDA
jgi:hypothetical protein